MFIAMALDVNPAGMRCGQRARKGCKQHINCPVMSHMICPVFTVSQEVDGTRKTAWTG